VIVSVNVDCAFSATVVGLNVIDVICGGASTCRFAVLLVAPVPPLVDVTALVVLSYEPAALPVIVVWNVQLELPAIVIALALSVGEFRTILPATQPAPPLSPDAVSPTGIKSVNPTPVSAVAFVLVIVKLNVVCPPNGIEA